MESYELLQNIKREITDCYASNEAEAISYLVLEHFGCSKTDVILKKAIQVDEDELDNILARLKNNEPIQYILGSGWFYDRAFEVNKYTLIPRSETEELVELILTNNKSTANIKILDIGTGSGCIPITLKLENQSWNVFGMDISKEALEVAKKNASNLKANVEFRNQDVFEVTDLNGFEIIVSNPPYVTNSEKQQMNKNVLDYEPASALFVEDTNPLLFYAKITKLASESETVKQLYFEINEQFGSETEELLLTNGFKNTAIVKDMQGKDRFVWGTKVGFQKINTNLTLA